ncbi:MAG: SDR family oxidoreductase [Oscillospiraceae bacterium]|nr:SDR family oxidoreductase [Oscillospiraceae bacterium]
MKTLQSKLAIVTGGSGVLGSNIAKALLDAGATVFIIGQHQEKVANTINSLKQFGNIDGTACNVLDTTKLQELNDYIINKYQHIDILVNAAGGNVPGATIMDDHSIFDMTIPDLHKVIDLNMYGTVYPCLVFGKTMATQKSGNIINISSMATYSVLTRVPGYSMAKTAINIFTQWLATEMALKFSEKIRVNAIAPGFFIGEQNRSALLNPDGSLTERSHKVIAKTPLRRFGNIDELNAMVITLCSDSASFITGTIIPIDGGFSAFSGV